MHPVSPIVGMEMVDLAREAFRSSNYDLAAGIYDKLLAEHGTNMEWVLGKAASLAKQNNFNEAVNCLCYACRLGHVQPNMFMVLIEPMVDYITRKAGRAVYSFRRRGIDRYGCWICFGILFEPITLPCGHSFCYDCLRDTRCLRTCHICRTHHPSLKLQNLQVNVSLRDAFEKYFPNEMKARHLKKDGNKFFKGLQYHRALERYTAALQMDQNDHLSLSNRSHIFNCLNLPDEALKDAETVCRLRPNWPKGYYRKATVLQRLNQYDGALLAYLQCLTLDPTVTSAKEAIAKIMHTLLSKPQTMMHSKRNLPDEASPLNILTTSNLSDLISMVIQILMEKMSLQSGDSDTKEQKSTTCTCKEDSMDAKDACQHEVDQVSPDANIKVVEDATGHGSSSNNSGIWGCVGSREPREIKPDLVKKEDFECSLCYRLFYHPVTTPCGHTFCKECLYRALDYNNRCPLCKGCLAEFLSKRYENADTVISDIISRHLPTEYRERQAQQHVEWQRLSGSVEDGGDEWVPIFVCTQPFPTIPCPLHVYEPRYRLMIRRCMDSGAQQFGMCTPSENGFSDVGVMLVIREVNHLEDGRSIVDTVGGRRFNVLERGMKDGYHTARVSFYEDIRAEGEDLEQVGQLNDSVYDMARTWYNNLLIPLKVRIDQHFGTMPEKEPDLQEHPDGPKWVWWLSAILPIDQSVQEQIVSKQNLHERLLILQHNLTRLTQS